MLKPQAMDLSRSGGIYPGYVLALLTLLYTWNFLDRQIINILAESMAIASFAAFGGTACYFYAGRHVLGDIERADLGHGEARGLASAPGVERPA